MRAAEPPPEITTIRLHYDPEWSGVCQGPQVLAQEFLRLEGFTDVHYEPYGNSVTEAGVIADGRADFVSSVGCDLAMAIDAGLPITVLGGVHAGCVEVFANDRVSSIGDLAGKRIAINAPGGAEHITEQTRAAIAAARATR